ncbi:mechanosensitive ion channel family protein [Litchfieldia alkalitelluris]|uniref:mechanosensitive ion channel family protein n=1 Tax=Litchfieldia alkalitelluris TaxID=304268 RepID=UPI0009970D0B|nr:mechanosensitive ion channel domain-containing protein [Litchfieldia alkalitelluris]
MEFIYNQLLTFGIAPQIAEYLAAIIMILFIGIICIIANFITRKIVIRVITHYVTSNKIQWDNKLLERRVFHKLSHIVPAIIIFYFASTFPDYRLMIEKAAIAYIIIISLLVIYSFLNAINDIYQTYEIAKVKPIKGYIQVVNIIAVIIGSILIISNLIGENPLILLSGFGALSAVLLLVFKDSLLGLVAGIQLAANDMVRVGDWIEMPKYGADGDIIDISLVTVKVQNWDKTITTIPSYALISDSFINWRGMQNSGGRRIKRSILIDTNSISFCTEEILDKFSHIQLLTDYINHKKMEIDEYNTTYAINKTNRVNGRAFTNVGIFRAYIRNYLRRQSGIRQDMTLMVRQLAPNEHGLPLEIYAFTNDVRWEVYETIQADIFDHLFAVAPEFGLRIFQNPSGNDLRNIVDGTERDGMKKQVEH